MIMSGDHVGDMAGADVSGAGVSDADTRQS